MHRDKVRALLKRHNLRVTGPRVAVVQLLAEADGPLAFSEVKGMMAGSDWDAATLYRNLVKLKEAGVTSVVSQAGGKARYALNTKDSHAEHAHPHFVCDDCGKVSCLPDSIVSNLALEGTWTHSLRRAELQFRGECPDCL